MLTNFLYKLSVYPFRKIQSLLGFITIGPRAIILNTENQILLVKHTYQPHWYLPGGGIKKGESATAALLRELKEEVGLIALEEPKLFGIYFNQHLGISDYPIIYIVKNYSITPVQSEEIEEKGWFYYHNLPQMISPGTKRRLDEYFINTAKTEHW